MINKKKLDEILATYSIKVTNYDHFIVALTHSSYANEHNMINNERIEFLGDSILGFLVAKYIYNTFDNLTEGKMTKLRATYVCENANAKHAKTLKLDTIILLGRGEEASGGRNRDTILNDAFEAFLGALYLTNGMKDVQKLLEQLVFPHIIANDQVEFIDYKSILQEYVQGETRSSVVYRLDNHSGTPNEPCFTMSVLVNNIVMGTGKGRSKKEASQDAAKNALSKVAIK